MRVQLLADFKPVQDNFVDDPLAIRQHEAIFVRETGPPEGDLDYKVAIFVVLTVDLGSVIGNPPELVRLDGGVGPLSDPLLDLMVDDPDTLLVDEVACLVTSTFNITLLWCHQEEAIMVVLARHSTAEDVIS